MALEYRFGGNTYDSAYALRLEHPEFVFPDDADAELLAPIGIELAETPDPAPDPEEARRLKLAEIDMETQQAIFGGFDYEIGGELLHFSYYYSCNFKKDAYFLHEFILENRGY